MRKAGMGEGAGRGRWGGGWRVGECGEPGGRTVYSDFLSEAPPLIIRNTCGLPHGILSCTVSLENKPPAY